MDILYFKIKNYINRIKVLRNHQKGLQKEYDEMVKNKNIKWFLCELTSEHKIEYVIVGRYLKNENGGDIIPLIEDEEFRQFVIKKLLKKKNITFRTLEELEERIKDFQTKKR